MRTVTYILILLNLLGCAQNDRQLDRQDDQTQEFLVPDGQSSYEFHYDKFTASYQGKTQTQNYSGTIVFMKKEVHIFRGNKGEKFFIKEFNKESSKLTLKTVNNLGDNATFTIFTINGKTKVESEFDGVIMKFSITKGEFSEIKLYANTDTDNQGDKDTRSTTTEADKDCNCEKINRDDGTLVTQCISLPVGKDNTTEVGLAMASNGQENFISLTVRFKGTVNSVSGDLSVRLDNNNLMTFELVNEQLAYIGNSQVAQGIFLATNTDINKLKKSDIQTLSFKLNDGLMYTYQATTNKNLLKKQIGCL